MARVGRGMLTPTENSPVSAHDSGTPWSAGHLTNILALWTSLGRLDRTSEWGGGVLWKLEAWIPKPLSGIKALDGNDYEPKKVKFLANLAFVKHCENLCGWNWPIVRQVPRVCWGGNNFTSTPMLQAPVIFQFFVSAFYSFLSSAQLLLLCTFHVHT